MNNEKLVGDIEKLPSNKIYININHLEKGMYNLNIVYKNRIIKSTHFSKE
tara:strand:- start:1319 stop:1468 length:150 start_codon:yes stop_codon:yes gene_type:complete